MDRLNSYTELADSVTTTTATATIAATAAVAAAADATASTAIEACWSSATSTGVRFISHGRMVPN